ncbi:heavy-metal-associated domain-containing protein [Arcicella aurantiaca]|uniref:Heavy-metal-associated domain-containing protein n=2 Tax=Arcicella aurantiaca TaxID=591202 RepID=A0A316EGI3_9BACT|nr:heavy-metal-associated domain-containing protein [Arcicella aurantiaca]
MDKNGVCDTSLQKMTQQFNISGMTCEACEYKIQHVFSQIPSVKSVVAKFSDNSVIIETEEKLSNDKIIETLKPHSKYAFITNPIVSEITTQSQSWTSQYYPLLLIAGMIAIVSFLTSFHAGIYAMEHFQLKMFLHNFMTGFFLVFSFFKLLDVKAFAESFQMYDLLAAKVPFYGKLYPFIELALGLLCLIHFQPQLVYWADIIIMAFGALGVIQSVVDKRKIRCACLGTVFNLPMSTVTIIENSLMVLIGIALLIML